MKTCEYLSARRMLVGNLRSFVTYLYDEQVYTPVIDCTA